VDLPAGLYTAIMSSSRAKGIGLVEANAIPLKKIRTMPFYLILRYLNEALPEIKQDTQKIKDQLKKDGITIISPLTPTKTLKSGNQLSIASTNEEIFDQVVSESLKLARPVLPFLDGDSLSCDDPNSCPLDVIDELFIVNNAGDPIPISGEDYENFLDKYTGTLENIEDNGVSVIKDNEVPDINQPFTLSESPLSLEEQQVVNIILPHSGQFQLYDGSDTVTVERIRVLPLPDTMSSPVSKVQIVPQNTSTVSIGLDKAPGSAGPGPIRYATFYVWWQFR
jgi:hypothetical protein